MKLGDIHTPGAPAAASVPRQLLEALAPQEPITREGMGGCIWCGGHPPAAKYGKARRYLSHHAEGCPWVAIRQLLGDGLHHDEISETLYLEAVRIERGRPAHYREAPLRLGAMLADH